MAAAARIALLLLLGCVGLLRPVGECQARGAAALVAGPGGSPALQAAMPAVAHPCPRLSPNRWQVHRLLPPRLVLLLSQLPQVLFRAPELGRS